MDMLGCDIGSAVAACTVLSSSTVGVVTRTYILAAESATASASAVQAMISANFDFLLILVSFLSPALAAGVLLFMIGLMRCGCAVLLFVILYEI